MAAVVWKCEYIDEGRLQFQGISAGSVKYRDGGQPKNKTFECGSTWIFMHVCWCTGGISSVVDVV